MLHWTPFSETIKDEWDALAASRGNVYHTSAFRRVLMTSFGYRCAYQAAVDERGRLRALLPLVTGRDLTWQKAGVSLPLVNQLDICADSLDAAGFVLAGLPAMAAGLGLDYLQLRLKEQAVTGPDWTVDEDNYTFILPLAGGEEAVLALSSAHNRNHVRKTYRHGWFAASFDAANLAAFYRVYARRMHELGSPAPSLGFFRAIFAELGEAASLLTVLDKGSGEVVGGMVLLASAGDDTLYYPYGASLTEYNNRYINSFMYWEAVKFGLRAGLARLDLGRSPRQSGTYRYKEQWGATPVPLRYAVHAGGQTGRGPAARAKLGLGVRLWQAAPAFFTDAAGPVLIKYLMP